MNQQEINFNELSHIENNISNQEHFERNKERFSNQCRIVYEALLRGERLTTAKALIDYKIGDLRRRIKDLRDIWNVPIHSEYKEGKFKEFFLKN
ncbi:helix-turn-helix domain-containing protein [Flavobacterium anhuiense]|uniref:helix-turn-helix domain-containing protein n=1 Tax=Flavobacterium anhuiense TaxID=459526 RepID=UPI002025FC6F|nr:helix-turn-helix domain-containing protein [Flavobacterium anhuiense]URM37184.1 helix-turn-helix domain-containing protein [Flavobacterium anhuiense]